MNWKTLSVASQPFALAFANHLWQSTLFVAIVALLAFILRKNHAQIRYWLWFAASMKFLLPFSLLMTLGSSFAYLHHTNPQQTAHGSIVTIAQISQPFTISSTFDATSPAAPDTTSISGRLNSLWNRSPALPTSLAAVWLIGFVVIVARWAMRWRSISAAIQLSAPLHKGREFEILQRMKRLTGVRPNIELRLLTVSMEPGIFGLFRSVLLWPQAITSQLDDAQLEAVLAHELCHVRRRDNLTAALHMLVQALFWFHPIVWWLETRLVQERENACDEEVLRLCGQRTAYAESILKVCEFCIESPLPCTSGITGADLRRRIVQIMTDRTTLNLTTGKKLLLAVTSLLIVAVPIVLGQAKRQTFEVASIRPANPGSARDYTGENIAYPSNRFTLRFMPLKVFINLAYGTGKISGGPDWVYSQLYSVNAKVEGETRLSPTQMRPLLQNLLADRFHLKVHHVQTMAQGYALVVAKGGPKLEPTKGGPFAGINSLCELKYHNDSIENFGKTIGYWSLKRPVVDSTGLEGMYDFDLKYVPDDSPLANDPRCANLPDIFVAVQQQLGLKLVPQKVPVDSIVIDEVERPTEN